MARTVTVGLETTEMHLGTGSDLIWLIKGEEKVLVSSCFSASG